MASDYTDYQQRYDYMNRLLSQIHTTGGNIGQSYAGRASSVSTGESFANIYRRTAQNLNVPESMDDIFKEAAERYQVPVNLLMAVGKAESGFDSNAVSPVGAQGVMQLMPATAAALGVEDPFDARSNIMGGAKYIAEKLNQYDGDIELALAAYNAGSGNVEKYGGVPPFAETQNYIRKIKEYMGTELTTGKTVSTQDGNNASETGQGTLGTIQKLQSISVLQALQQLNVLQLLQTLYGGVNSNQAIQTLYSGTGSSQAIQTLYGGTGSSQIWQSLYGGAGSSQNSTKNTSGNSAEYLVDLMKLQMQNRTGTLGQSLLDTE